MSPLNLRRIGWVGMVALMLLTVGCASTRVNFQGPPGTVLSIDDKPHHLPADVELQRPGGVGASKRYPVTLAFPSQQFGEVRAKGHIDVFGYTESDVDKLSAHTCNLEESELVKILDGRVVIFKGLSASRQPIYDLTLGKE